MQFVEMKFTKNMAVLNLGEQDSFANLWINGSARPSSIMPKNLLKTLKLSLASQEKKI